jgi:hypothetical protein
MRQGEKTETDPDRHADGDKMHEERQRETETESDRDRKRESVLVLWQLARHRNAKVRAQLWGQGNTADLLDLRVVGGRDAVQETAHLRGGGSERRKVKERDRAKREKEREREREERERERKRSVTWVRRSAIVINFLRTFLGRMYV